MDNKQIAAINTACLVEGKWTFKINNIGGK
jgi:hypothetical protein